MLQGLSNLALAKSETNWHICQIREEGQLTNICLLFEIFMTSFWNLSEVGLRLFKKLLA